MFGIGMKEIGIIVLVLVVLFALSAAIPRTGKRGGKETPSSETNTK
jgi:Sec-independent protein translocase protein TatA